LKKPPDKGKPWICSCCTYSSSGKKTVILSSKGVKKLLTLPVIINKATKIKALLDSGASGNFIHQGMVKELGLGLRKREQPQPVNDIQGKR